MANTKEEAPTKNNEKAPVKAKKEARTKVTEEAARTKTDEDSRAKVVEEAQAEEEALVGAEEEARAKAEDEIVNFQELGKERCGSTVTVGTFLNTIAADATDYSKRSVENGPAFVEKLLGAKSFERAIHFQSEYARTSHADFVAYLTKFGELYSELAKIVLKRRPYVA
jgi:Phasin protein